jgi:hypothetical protein
MADPARSTNLLDEVRSPEVPDARDYSEEERQYLGGQQILLENTCDVRESTHDELDGMTYSQYGRQTKRRQHLHRAQEEPGRLDGRIMHDPPQDLLLLGFIKFEFYASILGKANLEEPPDSRASAQFDRLASLFTLFTHIKACDNLVTIFRRNQPKSAVVLAMASGCNS